MRQFLVLSLVVCLGVAATPRTTQAGPIQLALIIDDSGSIGSSNFAAMQTGLANALGTLPTNGSVELSVVKFSSGVVTVLNPTLINSVGTLNTAIAAINGMAYTAGNTNMAGGITQATSLVTGSALFPTASRQVFNLVTDGVPNFGNNSIADTIAAGNAAMAAGIDELSAEFIGDVGDAGFTFLRDSLVFPTPGYQAPPFIPGQGFVFPVSDFGQTFEDAFRQKLQFVVSGEGAVPEPASMAVFGLGAVVVGGLYRRTRKGEAASAA